jgi:hypothetical protein
MNLASSAAAKAPAAAVSTPRRLAEASLSPVEFPFFVSRISPRWMRLSPAQMNLVPDHPIKCMACMRL